MDKSEGNQPPIDHLVVDSSGFLHHGPIRETAKQIYTCPEILEELKSLSDSERASLYQCNLQLIQFDRDDLDWCIKFARKTGDYHQLSAVDLKLIAATYRLEKRFNGDKFIQKEPRPAVVKPLEKIKTGENDKTVNKLSKLLDATGIDGDGNLPMDSEELDRILDDEAKSNDFSDDSDDDDWITPQNISKVYEKMGVNKTGTYALESKHPNRVPVACMTSDFSIQNCLIQMGINVVSPNGLMIKVAKKIALRCHACLKLFTDLAKIKNGFCPHCGNQDTLKRVNYQVNEDGTVNVFINYKRPIKVKGNNKQLPRPRGGKHANNPVLAPDQKVRRDKQDKFVAIDKKILSADHILNDPAYLVRTNPFAHKSCKIPPRRRR